MLTQKPWVPMSLSPASLSAFDKSLNLFGHLSLISKMKNEEITKFSSSNNILWSQTYFTSFPSPIWEMWCFFSRMREVWQIQVSGINEMLSVKQLHSASFPTIFPDLARVVRDYIGFFSFWSHAWFWHSNNNSYPLFPLLGIYVLSHTGESSNDIMLTQFLSTE